MRKKKNVLPSNFLERRPRRKEGLKWTQSDEGRVSLHIENKGVFHTLAQKLLAKPRISYVHLDKMGSFLWPLLEGDKTLTELGLLVKEQFGDDEYLYERLAKYMQTLDSYHFIEWNE